MRPLFLFFLHFTLASSLSAQNTATRKVMLTLQEGEKIITYESCLGLSLSGNNLYLVTHQGKNVFVYDGTQRKGPFKQLSEANPRDCNDDNQSNECANFEHSAPENIMQNITYSDNGGILIQFNGKKFGPYAMVNAFHPYPDNSGFVALVADNNFKFSLATADKPLQPLEGSSPTLTISSTGKNYLVTARENHGMSAAEAIKIDYSKMTQEELIKMAQDQETKIKNAGPPKAYIYTKSQKFGPFPADQLSDNNPAFCKTGDDNWYMVLENNLYINGVKTKELSDEIDGTCKVWISGDGKRYALITYDKIIFSDGNSYEAPLKISFETKTGKSVLTWISLENEKELVQYSREI